MLPSFTSISPFSRPYKVLNAPFFMETRWVLSGKEVQSLGWMKARMPKIMTDLVIYVIPQIMSLVESNVGCKARPATMCKSSLQELLLCVVYIERNSVVTTPVRCVSADLKRWYGRQLGAMQPSCNYCCMQTWPNLLIRMWHRVWYLSRVEGGRQQQFGQFLPFKKLPT